MGLIDDCEKYFGTKSLLDVYQISREKASNLKEVKAAYRKLSLLHHPDKVTDDRKETATAKFQTISKIYCILSDKEKCAAYLETGFIDEENVDFEDRDWYAFWKLIFPAITVKDIDNYFLKYKNSQEEFDTLKDCHSKAKGDFKIFEEYFIGYESDEEEIYKRILHELDNGDETAAFNEFSTLAEFRKKNKEKKSKKTSAKQAEVDELAKAILQRRNEREKDFGNLIKSLEEKYSNTDKKRRKKK